MPTTCEQKTEAEIEMKLPFEIQVCLIGIRSMAEDGDWDRVQIFAKELARLARVQELESKADECGVVKG